MLVAGVIAALAGCGGVETLDASDGAPPAAPSPQPSATATATSAVTTATATTAPATDPAALTAEAANSKGLWTRLDCGDRGMTGVVYGRLPPSPAPDRTAAQALGLFLERVEERLPPFNQLADLTWERRNFLKRPARWDRHTVFIGSRDGVERAMVHADRVQPGPTWVTDDFSLCVEPVPPRVNPDRTFDAALSCPGEVTRVATDPPFVDWGVASETYLRHALYEFGRWTRIAEDFGWPQGLKFERRQPHTQGHADMIGTKDGVERAVVSLEHMATHGAWVMTGYAFCTAEQAASGPEAPIPPA